MNTTVLPATGEVSAGAGFSSLRRDLLEQPVERLQIVRLAEEFHDRLGNDAADAAHRQQLLPRRIALGQRLGRDLGLNRHLAQR